MGRGPISALLALFFGAAAAGSIVFTLATRRKRDRLDLPVVLYPGEDGYIVAEVPALPGCITQGRSEKEALSNAREAAALCLESMEEEGWTLPESYSMGHIEVLTSDA